LPTPLPTLSLKALDATYTKLAKAMHTADCKAVAVFSNTGSTVTRLKQAATSMARAWRAFADGLRRIRWPSTVASDAKALIKSLAATEAAYVLASEGTTRSGIIDDLNRAYNISLGVSAAANLLRGDLGLSSVKAAAC